VEITCQNHGFAVDASSLRRTSARLTHVNLNDHTVEGLEVRGDAFSVQYHPESGPGPHDSRYLFTRFVELMARFEARDPVERHGIESLRAEEEEATWEEEIARRPAGRRIASGASARGTAAGRRRGGLARDRERPPGG
jgi:hypothetical protein